VISSKATKCVITGSESHVCRRWDVTTQGSVDVWMLHRTGCIYRI